MINSISKLMNKSIELNKFNIDLDKDEDFQMNTSEQFRLEVKDIINTICRKCVMAGLRGNILNEIVMPGDLGDLRIDTQSWLKKKGFVVRGVDNVIFISWTPLWLSRIHATDVIELMNIPGDREHILDQLASELESCIENLVNEAEVEFAELIYWIKVSALNGDSGLSFAIRHNENFRWLVANGYVVDYNPHLTTYIKW